MKKILFIIAFVLTGTIAFAQNSKGIINERNTEKDYPKSLASYTDFENLTSEVENYRKKTPD